MEGRMTRVLYEGAITIIETITDREIIVQTLSFILVCLVVVVPSEASSRYKVLQLLHCKLSNQ